MGIEVWSWVLAGLVLVHLAWLVWTLARLRRLARRVQLAWSALDVLLQRRASLVDHALDAAGDAMPPQAVARLRAAVADTRDPGGGDREAAENALGRALRATADLDGLPPAVLAELEDTGTRVSLARRFYNDAVRDTRSLRETRFSRVQRLHARRPMPRFFDIDDGTRGPGTRTVDTADRTAR